MPNPLLLSYAEAAASLGISQRTLRRLVEAEEITPVRLRGRVLFTTAELESLIPPVARTATQAV